MCLHAVALWRKANRIICEHTLVDNFCSLNVHTNANNQAHTVTHTCSLSTLWNKQWKEEGKKYITRATISSSSTRTTMTRQKNEKQQDNTKRTWDTDSLSLPLYPNHTTRSMWKYATFIIFVVEFYFCFVLLFHKSSMYGGVQIKRMICSIPHDWLEWTMNEWMNSEREQQQQLLTLMTTEATILIIPIVLVYLCRASLCCSFGSWIDWKECRERERG